MPITRSAKKALRQSLRRRSRNLARSAAYKRAVKDLRSLLAAGKAKEAEKLLPSLQKSLDKAAKANVITRRKAARLKSRLAKLVRRARERSVLPR